MRCPYCGEAMVLPRVKRSGAPADNQRTKDHIWPRSWGKRGPPKVIRIRYVCARCNVLRSTCGHCIGALACVLSTAAESGEPTRTLIRRWKLGVVGSNIAAPIERKHGKG
jgi:hypothetical protein